MNLSWNPARLEGASAAVSAAYRLALQGTAREGRGGGGGGQEISLFTSCFQ